jgi:hypothetical protein
MGRAAVPAKLATASMACSPCVSITRSHSLTHATEAVRTSTLISHAMPLNTYQLHSRPRLHHCQ